MSELLAKSDYPPLGYGPVLTLVLGLLAAAAVLAVVAWSVGAFDRTRKGRHAADVPPMSPWVNDRYKAAMEWLERDRKAQADLLDAQQGSER